MALREVEPLNAEQWKQLTDALDRGPTPAQVKIVEDAVKYFKDIEQKRQKE